jgi:hypothetical protein
MTHRSLRNLLCAASLCIVATACETIDIKTDHDPQINFSGYRTFAWISKSPLVSRAPEVSPLAEGRIQNAVRNTLTQKGFRYVEDPNQADFVIAFTLGSRQKLQVTSTPYAASYGTGPYMWGRPYYQDVDVRQYTQGRLAIDIFDTKAREPVWTGVATKSITSSDQKRSEELINEVVAKILAGFPPR